MSKKSKNLRSEQRSCSDEDRTSVSDLRKLMEKQFGDIMRAIQEVNGRVMKLECGMERLSIGMKSDIVEIKTHSFRPGCFKLVFNNKISLPVLNGEEIKGEGGKYLEVALVDDVTGNIVDFGREASANVEIVALEGDSDDCERDTWVIGNYKNKIAKAGEETMSVFGGKVKLKLNKGIGSLVGIKFRNSSNHNSGVFKLGAKLIDSFEGTTVKEAMTESFIVKDFRKKYKRKHYPPSLSDEVWRLENIQKGGAVYERLKERVKTVEDFLIQLLKDSAGLKSLLDLPETKWKATVRHAQTCTINQKRYCSINSQENKGVVFNVVGQVLGLIKDWNYVPRDMLSQEDKVDARKLFAAAFDFQEGVKDFDDEASLLQYLSCQSTAVSTNSPKLGNTVSHEVETSKSGEFDQANINASSQDVFSSKNPSGGTVSQEDEASVLDRFDLQDILPSNNPTGCTGLEAPLYGPICMDQYNVVETNLNASSQDVFSSKNPSGGTVSQEAEASVHDRFDLQDIFPSINPIGGTRLEAPLFSPYNDDQENLDDSFWDALLSLSPSKGEVSNEVEASEPHGFGLQDILSSINFTGGGGLENFGSQVVKDMEMRTNRFLSSHEQYPPLGPLWIDQYNVQSSCSSLIDNVNLLTQVLSGESHNDDPSSCLKHAAKRSWKVLLSVIKWFLKVKKAAFRGNRSQKKQRIS